MKTSRTTRTALLATLTLAMTMGSVTAYARPGSSHSSAGSSHSSSVSSAPRSVSSGRAGGGASSGMSRSSVMASARQQSPSNATQAANSGNYAAPSGGSGGGSYGANNSAASQPRRGFTGGQLAGAAAAGAVGGYLLHGATQPNQPVIVNNGGGVPNAGVGYGPSGGGYAPAAAYAGGSGSSGGMGVFGFLVLLALLGAGGYVLYRKFGTPTIPGASGTSNYYAASARAPTAATSTFSSASPNMNTENELLNSAPQSFRSIQDAYSRGDRSAVATLVDDSYLSQFTADMAADAGNPVTQVHSVKVVGGRVLGFEQQDERYVGSVHYQADITEGNGPSQEIEEVWHFVRPINGGSWKLAGIQQM